jgi:hypothetical protein
MVAVMGIYKHLWILPIDLIGPIADGEQLRRNSGRLGNSVLSLHA